MGEIGPRVNAFKSRTHSSGPRSGHAVERASDPARVFRRAAAGREDYSAGGVSRGTGFAIRFGAGAGFGTMSGRSFIIARNFLTLSGARAAPVRSCLANVASIV
jgi:hypothetical protein